VTVGRAQPGFIVPGGDSPGAIHVKGSSQGEEFVRLSEKPKGAERRRRPTPLVAQGPRYKGTLAGVLPAVSQTITGVFTSAMSAAMILMQEEIFASPSVAGCPRSDGDHLVGLLRK